MIYQRKSAGISVHQRLIKFLKQPNLFLSHYFNKIIRINAVGFNWKMLVNLQKIILLILSILFEFDFAIALTEKRRNYFVFFVFVRG
jgi:hypothetical protein